ncbi:MAG: glycosyltransferase family 4 protein [Candidatus Bathyarchaeia archaeon]|jgi:glycosyltransferase involved in cell wall biosynthesis
MRIALFVWEYPPTIAGGLGTYAQYMAPGLVKKGHEVSVFTLNRGRLPTHEIIDGVDVNRPLISDTSNVLSLIADHSLRRWGSGLRFFSDIMMYNTLSASKLLNELIIEQGCKFDMVSFHDWLSGIAGLMVKQNSDLPCVFHVHSTEWGRTNGRGSEVVSSIEKASSDNADQVVTVSNAMKHDLITHGWNGDKINVIWNGVDPSKYDPSRFTKKDAQTIRRKYQINEDESMVLFVGRLTQIKGAMELINSMVEVQKRSPKAKLVILGIGEQENEIQYQVNNLGLTNNVKLQFEFLSEEERIQHYAASDVCVFPSTYEPFGIVSLEAMAMAKPVVVGARGVVGFAEQVLPNGPEKCGIHVNGGDPIDIAWGINEVLSDKEEAKVWGQNGRRRVLECFTWDRAVSETLKIYQNVIH